MEKAFFYLSEQLCGVPKTLASFPPQLPTYSPADTSLLNCSSPQLPAPIMAPSRFNPTTSRPLLPPVPAQITLLTPTLVSKFSVMSSKRPPSLSPQHSLLCGNRLCWSLPPHPHPMGSWWIGTCFSFFFNTKAWPVRPRFVE